MISERRHAKLGLIIEHYLRTGEPIGSKALCQLLPYSISSATIRNEMAYLTQLGFLEQRHTSGGRVPSKTSFRYYVDNIMKEKPKANTRWKNQWSALGKLRRSGKAFAWCLQAFGGIFTLCSILCNAWRPLRLHSGCWFNTCRQSKSNARYAYGRQ